MNTKKERKEAFNAMSNCRTFEGKILLIGFGCIGSSLIPVLTKFIKIDTTKLYIIDKDKSRFKNLDPKFTNINLINLKLTKDNTEKVINDIGLGQDDIIIDASYEIDTNYMYDLCTRYGISYTNSALEIWELDPKEKNTSFTFYSRLKSIEDIDEKILNKKNNFIVSLGCNPGNVNIWTLYALKKINEQNQNYEYKSLADLANKMGLRVVHISEKDSQITNNPKRQNEYLNTWSSNAISWYDEAFSYLEISWGTHEKNIPEKLNKELTNDYQNVIDLVGCESFARTYTPINKNTIGMLIRHEETYTICRKLTLRDESNNIIYKPSCYYIYSPCDSSVASINEVKEKGKYQDNNRLMTIDVVEGRDELGCTLFFENGDIYWVGSLLDINEARELLDNEYNHLINATNMQVLGGYIGSIFYLIDNIKEKNYKGLLDPEDLPVEEFVNNTRPFFGEFGIFKVDDWTNNGLLFEDFKIS